MRDLPNGASMQAILVVVLVIGAFFASAFILLPKGFSSDTTIIGRGSNVAVLAHNKDSVQSLTLIELMNKVRDDYKGRIKFIVADVNTPEGRKFVDDQNVEPGSLLLFGSDGIRRQVVSNINNQSILRSELDAVFK